LIFIKRFIPKSFFPALSPAYHKLMVFAAALFYRFPSGKIFVLGVTGTKGKTTVVEIVSAILEEAGHKTAIISTLRFKIADRSVRNKLKMTMPGRFFIQEFLRKAVSKKCDYVIVEMTSQGASQFRHKFIELDAMIFTNLSPEHLEAHGSFEKYKEAKLSFFEALSASSKPEKVSVVNVDDESAEDFLKFKIKNTWMYGLGGIYGGGEELKISNSKFGDGETEFSMGGKDFTSNLVGEFNLYNILAAMSFARSQGVGWGTIKKTLLDFPGVPGRVELIEGRQSFRVIVDYAHTPDSLEKLYGFFGGSRKICVLGAAGGGRDSWKRKEMGKIAGKNCEEIILTNEDPYDENPMEIIKEVASGIESPFKYKIIPDRREAIREALKMAERNDAVLITGKGTDPWIMGPGGSKTEWDDRETVKQELKRLGKL